MAHGIQATDKVYLHKEPAWHGLGKVFAVALTGEETRQEVCPWEPRERFLWMKTTPDGAATFKCPSRKALVRSDTGAFIADVGMGYMPFLNRQLFEAIDKALPGVRYETAGTLGGGRRVWALAELSKFEVQKGDETKQYLMAACGHDGNMKVYFGLTGIRIVCQNTFNSAVYNAKENGEANEGVVAYRHTKNIASKVFDAAKAIAAAQEEAKKMADTAKRLAACELKRNQELEYFKSVFPAPKTRKAGHPAPVDGAAVLNTILEVKSANAELVSDLLAGEKEATDRQIVKHERLLTTLVETYHAPQNAGDFGNNLWTAFNACTDFIDHQRSTRGTDEADRAENRFASLMWGSGNDLKQVALAQAVKAMAAR